MQFSKAAVLILSAVRAASAEFPNTRNSNGMKSVGRRLNPAMSEECATACKDKGHSEAMKAYVGNMAAVDGGDYSALCPHTEAIKCMDGTAACQDKPGRRLSNETTSSASNGTSSSGSGEASSASNGTSSSGSSEASSSGTNETSSSGSSEAASSSAPSEAASSGSKDEKEKREERSEEEMRGEEPSMSETISCSCACPESMKAMDSFEKNMCKKPNPLQCMMKNSACAGMIEKIFLKGKRKSDFEKQIELRCGYEEKGCKKKEEEMSKCSGKNMDKYETEGCDQAASDGTLASKADKCCAAAEKIIECKSVECVNIENEFREIEAKGGSDKDKDEMKKETKKQMEIGTVCPGTGLAPPEVTTSKAWASLPHAIALVAVVGSLIV